MYSVPMTTDNYRNVTAVEIMMAERKATSAILIEFFALPAASSAQMVPKGLKAFEVMNLDKNRPGALLNAIA